MAAAPEVGDQPGDPTNETDGDAESRDAATESQPTVEVLAEDSAPSAAVQGDDGAVVPDAPEEDATPHTNVAEEETASGRAVATAPAETVAASA